ncbi:hypothetical protein AB205_0051430 [Aquarana catesbeiana]|uniref:Uncharacterized protein n=1 Tax=Aquarana catesbeiana TaxID=8400 RepID=A0A2G9S1V7_AQUCT|nr:hypothetical protein AB205_0051430 [Aquarana catesbeiana]
MYCAYLGILMINTVTLAYNVNTITLWQGGVGNPQKDRSVLSLFSGKWKQKICLQWENVSLFSRFCGVMFVLFSTQAKCAVLI